MHNSKPPVFLNLLRIRQSPMAMVSVAHRLSGIILFCWLPLAIYLLQQSLLDAAGFQRVVALFSQWPLRLVSLLGLWALLHHILAGVRLLLLDMEIGVEVGNARRSALAVTLSALLLALLIGAGWWL